MPRRGDAKRLVCLTIPLTGAAVLFSLLTGCGGGGGGSTSPPPPTVSVTISPKTATIAPSATQQFTATVTGATNTAVTWQVNGTAGGSSSAGTISSSGLYTAPSAVPSGNSVTVAAVSQADTTKSDSAKVTISPPSLTSLSPDVAMAGSGGLTLTVNGAAFTSSSQVVFNGAGTPTTFVNSSQLTAAISAADIAQASPTAGYPVAVQTGASVTSALNFYVVPPVGPQGVAVSVGPATHVPTLSVTPDNQAQPLLLSFAGAGNQAGVTGGEVSRGNSATLLLVGNGLVPGTFYAISGSNDVTVTQPATSDFASCSGSGNGGATTPCVTINVSVSASAALGPRNIVVTDTGGELSAFVGGLLVTQ
ncbi:MAG TPA: hypothetical protein VG204_03505 [Terriglobia bacterium]|nr:hypothetical protein [Terriglobia bacterium]